MKCLQMVPSSSNKFNYVRNPTCMSAGRIGRWRHRTTQVSYAFFTISRPRKGLDGLPVPRCRPPLAWLLNKDELKDEFGYKQEKVKQRLFYRDGLC